MRTGTPPARATSTSTAAKKGGRAARAKSATGGAWKGDHRERVAGEGLPAQDHEPAGDAGHDGDDRARLEGVDHERVRDELVDIGERIPGKSLEDRRLRHGGRRARTAPRVVRRPR